MTSLKPVLFLVVFFYLSGCAKPGSDQIPPHAIPSKLAQFVAARYPVRSWGIETLQVEEVWKLAKSKGAGIKILQLDTGVDSSHPLLQGVVEGSLRLRPQVSQNELPTPYFDENGHGTAVAGVMVSQPDEARGFSGGVCPDAKLFVAKFEVPDPWYSQELFNEMGRAVDWGIKNSVDVILLSVALEEDLVPTEITLDQFTQAIKRAYLAGIPIVAASGNLGSSSISYPAKLDEVLSVGAVNINNERSFSQYGSNLDLVAPGESILSTFPKGRALLSRCSVSYQEKEEEIPCVPFVLSKQELTKGSLQNAGSGKKEDFSEFIKGHIALINREPRTDISIQEQIKNAYSAGARALALCNSEPILSTKFSPLTSPESPIPVVYLDRKGCLSLVKKVSGEDEEISTEFAFFEGGSLISFSGTSMSAPFAAGVIALMRSTDSTLKPARIYEILRKTAIPLYSVKNEFGYGIINPMKAVEEVLLNRK